jgi:hypothetical protein
MERTTVTDITYFDLPTTGQFNPPHGGFFFHALLIP